MSRSSAGRVAVVTGGARGFGKAITEAFAERGVSVGVFDLDRRGADRVARNLNRRKGSAKGLAVCGDVTRSEDVVAGFAMIEQELGPISILVNNVGMASATPLPRMSREEWDTIIEVNLTSMFVCCKVVVPDLIRRRRGAIVNISSSAGKRGGGFLTTTAYSSAKAGVIGFTKALARELAPFGIRVNCVAPAVFETDMTTVLKTDQDLRRRVLAAVPMGKCGEPEDVAQAVVFLASDEAGYITGETINVDGGLMME
jgi:3-oxoacyl-[acyl-carrier protein] reductase